MSDIQNLYLYGAAVQGIQNFIFQTNDLIEIVGASEIVSQICTSKFTDNNIGGIPIVMAAGNIKVLFKTDEEVKAAVLKFPMVITQFALGITISQSVVEINCKPSITDVTALNENNVNDYISQENFSSAVGKLEENLRAQRNKSSRSTTLGLTAISRSRKTGLPLAYFKKDFYLDIATYNKRELGKSQATTPSLCKMIFGDNISYNNIAYNITDITEHNDWIAVIHIDGNNLGRVIQEIGGDPMRLKKFSKELDSVTKKAAAKAYTNLCENKLLSNEGIIPLRPVVLSGDDHTIICRADLAIPYTKAFFKAFEKGSKEMLKEVFKKTTIKIDRLTACAGIAYIKSSYPFYYAYSLAEDLCTTAKKDAKRNENPSPKSCLMFHKVQDSFIENYSEIIKRELTLVDGNSLCFGPYYLENEDERWTIDKLMNNATLNSDVYNPIYTHIRGWLTLMHNNVELARQKMLRLKNQSPEKVEIINLLTEFDNERKSSPAYDVLAQRTIINQTTK